MSTFDSLCRCVANHEHCSDFADLTAAIRRRCKSLRLSSFDATLFTSLLLYGNAYELTRNSMGGSIALTALDVTVQIAPSGERTYTLQDSEETHFDSKLAGHQFLSLVHYACPLFYEQVGQSGLGKPALVFASPKSSASMKEQYVSDICAELDYGTYDWVWHRRLDNAHTVKSWVAVIR